MERLYAGMVIGEVEGLGLGLLTLGVKVRLRIGLDMGLYAGMVIGVSVKWRG